MRTFLFILGLVLLVALGLFLKNKGIFSLSADKPSLQAKFSPSSLINLLDKASVDYMTGVCKDSGYVLYQSDPSTLKSNTGSYIFYLGPKVRSYEENSQTAYENSFSEKIATYDEGKSLFYTIKNREPFEAFIKLLTKEGEILPDSIKTIISANIDSAYTIQNFIFIDEGYTLNSNGFTVKIIPTARLVHQGDASVKAFPKKQTVFPVRSTPKQAQTTSNRSSAYVSVNEAHAYEHPGTYFGVIANLNKGGRVSIVKSEGEFYYCDFTDANGNPRTGWFLKYDISSKK